MSYTDEFSEVEDNKNTYHMFQLINSIGDGTEKFNDENLLKLNKMIVRHLEYKKGKKIRQN